MFLESAGNFEDKTKEEKDTFHSEFHFKEVKVAKTAH